MAVLIVAYLLVVFLVPLLVGAVATYRALPRHRNCGSCGGSTVRVAGRGHAWVRRLVSGAERRWCPACQWEGWVRAPARRSAAATPAATLDAAPEATRAATPAPSLALDVRTLRVDGGLWRVQLQWWPQPPRCQGRMVFIAPTGKRLRDGVQCFSGATQTEVLGQALSIPDGLLVNRVRQLLASSER